MTKKQFDKINNDVNKLLNGEKIRGIDLSVYDIRELVNVLENLKKKPEFINRNVKREKKTLILTKDDANGRK